NPTDYSFVVNGPLTAYMLVNTPADLQAIGTNLSSTGTYALGRNIVAGSMAPIGSTSTPFNGVLEGQNYTISNATITAAGSGDNNVGMFAAIGSAGIVRNLNLSNFTVTATASGQVIGTLAGSNAGTISSVKAIGGSVSGGQGVIAGGLVGQSGVLLGSGDTSV